MIELEQTEPEKQEIESKQEVVKRISQQIQETKQNDISFDKEKLQERHENLKNKPILESGFLVDTTFGIEKEPTFCWVETNKIIGRPFGSRYHNGWSFEYDNRKGRAVSVAEKLHSLLLVEDNSKNEEIVEYIFHIDKSMHRITLDEIEGPSGPMYSVRDGTHRIAGMMLAGLKEIPCNVHKIKYPLENTTDDKEIANNWKKKIDLGLIQGKIETLNDERGIKYKLMVEKEVLPWIRTHSQNQLIKISQAYEKLYPNSLNNLKIPREALINPIANNYFMAGRWAEWEKSKITSTSQQPQQDIS